MTHRVLKKPMRVWRIGDPEGRYEIFSGLGAKRTSGRWHNKGQEVIYCAEQYSAALLEHLVHFNGILPPNQHFIEITIATGVSYEVVSKDTIANWDSRSGNESRAFGSTWLTECRSAVLLVPSVPAREERNVLINPAHEHFARIEPGIETPVKWDGRLF